MEEPFCLSLKSIPLQDETISPGYITRGSIPLTLIAQVFSLAKRDVASWERESFKVNTSVVYKASIDVARMEDDLIFKGIPGSEGLLSSKDASHFDFSRWDKIGTAADDVIKGITLLDKAGFHGPYARALTPARYNMLFRKYPQGFMTELEHIRIMVTEGIYKAPTLDAGGVLVALGPQYASIVLGQDMSIAFIGARDEMLDYTVSESLALYIRQAGALCVLKEAAQ